MKLMKVQSPKCTVDGPDENDFVTITDLPREFIFWFEEVEKDFEGKHVWDEILKLKFDGVIYESETIDGDYVMFDFIDRGKKFLNVKISQILRRKKVDLCAGLV
jgi:hypothetical protein